MSKKNEVKVDEARIGGAKVGDKIIMNQDFKGLDYTAYKGDIGYIYDSLDLFYALEFPGKGSICALRERFDLAPDQPANNKPPEKKSVKKGIRITVREVRPDVFEIIDFTALDVDDLPAEYRDGFPFAGMHGSFLRVSESKNCHNWYSRGNFLTRKRLDKLVKTCKEAGKRLREINTFPKEAFEIVI